MNILRATRQGSARSRSRFPALHRFSGNLEQSPFVLAVRQKYTTEPQTRRAGYLLCDVSKQRVARLMCWGPLECNSWVEGAFFSSFRFPETKSAHLKFFPLSDNNPWRLICSHAMYLFV